MSDVKKFAGIETFTTVCRVEVANETPPGYNIAIVGVGLEFTYREGGTYTTGDPNLNLISGERRYFYSQVDHCVGKVYCVIRYQRVNGNIGVIDGTQEASPGKCAEDVKFAIAPAFESAQGSKEPFPRLQLVAKKA